MQMPRKISRTHPNSKNGQNKKIQLEAKTLAYPQAQNNIFGPLEGSKWPQNQVEIESKTIQKIWN